MEALLRRATIERCTTFFSEASSIWELKTSLQKPIWRKIELLPDENPKA